jgi:hypothetical protein
LPESFTALISFEYLDTVCQTRQNPIAIIAIVVFWFYGYGNGYKNWVEKALCSFKNRPLLIVGFLKIQLEFALEGLPSVQTSFLKFTSSLFRALALCGSFKQFLSILEQISRYCK